ncbi:hypothetical protein WMQ28_14125 [Vibrio metschnikovii]|uniref:hypothetical protein n=1 Tax=Vibrio metschnikovii TaxID=28172 RepID=UPI0037509BA4
MSLINTISSFEWDTFSDSWNDLDLVHISEHSDQSFRDYPITHFGLNRSLIPRLSDHF